MPKKKISDLNRKRLLAIGSYLRNYRINSSLNQHQLSKSRFSVIRLEKGCNVNLITLFEIADSLDLDIYTLFEEID